MHNEILKTINPKRNYKKLILTATLIAILLILLIGLIFWWKNRPPTYTYTTQEAIIGDITTSISANGTLSPTNEVSIGSVVSGIVLEVFVDVNDKVTQGQVLARIDTESIEQSLQRFQAQLTSAKAQLKSAQISLEEKKWQYQQLQNLYNKTQGKTPSRLDLHTAKTAYNSALSDVGIKEANIIEIQTSIRSTEVDLKNAHITSPIDGVVLSRSIEVGQSVAASFQAPEFFIIAENLEEMELNVSISEADIGKVKAGQEVQFSVDSYPDKTFNAKVERVNFGATKNTDSTNNIVSYEARIFVDNKNLLLKPGMSATADITTQSIKNTLLVPSSALYFNPTQPKTQKSSINPFKGGGMRPPFLKQATQKANSSLWVLENKIPKEIQVQIGISDGTYTQITSDSIKSGMQIITAQKEAK